MEKGIMSQDEIDHLLTQVALSDPWEFGRSGINPKELPNDIQKLKKKDLIAMCAEYQKEALYNYKKIDGDAKRWEEKEKTYIKENKLAQEDIKFIKDFISRF